MRKQYYFRPSPRGLLSWDADRLVRLIDAADLSYPIILSASGGVMDGMHRIVKAVLDGRTTIDAVQFDEDPDPDHVGVGPDDLPY